MDKMMEALQWLAEKIDGNKYLGVIKDALMIFVPITITASFASLFNMLLCNTSTGLARIPALAFLANLSPVFKAVNFAGLNCLTIALTFLIGYLMAKRNGISELVGGLTAFVSYVSIVPTFTTAKIGDEATVVSNVLPSGSMDASTMLIGMILAIVAVELLTRIMKIKAICIRMPQGVPPMIANTFNVLIPVMLTIMLISGCGYVVVALSGQYLTELFYTMLQKPMEGVMQSPAGILIIVFVTNLLWALGIHGGMVTRSVRVPFFVAALAGNIAAVEAGGVATNAVTETLWQVFIVIGGTGNCLALLLVILLVSKRKDYRTIAKLSLIPSIFGVSEPVIFGLPIVMNPYLVVPFVLSSLVTTSIGLVASSLGMIPCSIVEVPAGMPVLMTALVGYASIRAVFLQLLCIAVSCLIYLPFVLASNKEASAEME